MASSFKHTLLYVTTYANQVEAEIESRLHGHNKVASGDLYDSIGYTIKETPTKISLKFEMADYGKFVDKGVNGYMNGWGSPYSFKPKDGKGSGKKSEFITKLQKWCAIKGLPKDAAYPIRKNIWKNGIAPTNFFTLPTRRRAKQFALGVEKNLALDVEEIIQKDLKELKVKFKKK
jgi:hypothetical protein